MALPAPILDDRQFQDIVDELKKRIPLYCPEWTDHNVSDPGVTLIELFAWVADMLIYRINRIPDLHYIKFMELLGIQLKPPTPAQTEVTFYLSEAQLTDVSIPLGTEVSTTQTETEPPILFTTAEQFEVRPPQLATVLTEKHANNQISMESWDVNSLLTDNDLGIALFSQQPQTNDAFYFGFRNDLSQHVLRIVFDFQLKQGSGIRADLPPLLWEVSTVKPGNWIALDAEDVLDLTKGFNQSGRVELHLPHMDMYEQAGESRYWLRVRVIEPSSEQRKAGMRPYERSPELDSLREVVSIGGTLATANVTKHQCEILGTSDGSAGQHFFLREKPVLTPTADETLWVVSEEQPNLTERWIRCDHFANSKEDDPHYLLDCTTGEIRFGPAIPQPNGTIRCYGRTPPRGRQLMFEQYRTGGGVVGNVGKGKINRLKTSIPYVDRVLNRKPAKDGKDGQSLESAKLNVTGLMQTRERAVTKEDYEVLVKTHFEERIARAHCHSVAATVNQVDVLVIPHILPRQESQWLRRQDLDISKPLRDEIQHYLDERKMLTVQVAVKQPFYQWISVLVRLRTSALVTQSIVRKDIITHLEEFIHPLHGGVDGNGWPLSTEETILTKADIRNYLEALSIFRRAQLEIRGIELCVIDPDKPIAQIGSVDEIEIKGNTILVSYEHQVEFQS